MTPYLDTDIINGLQHSMEPAGDFVPEDALKTLKAVQDILNHYFAKCAPRSANSTITRPETHRIANNSLSDNVVETSLPNGADSKLESGFPGKGDKGNAAHNAPNAGSTMATSPPLISGLQLGAPGTENLVINSSEAAFEYSSNAMASKEAAKVPRPTDGVMIIAEPPENSKPTEHKLIHKLISSPGAKSKGPDPERLRALASTISHGVEQLTTPGNSHADLARLRTVTAALELANALRPPPEIIMSWFSNMSVVSAVRLSQDWGVFDAIPVRGVPDDTEQDITYTALAAKLHIEESLLVRIAGMLTSTSILHHIPGAPARLAHTPTSLLLRPTQPMGSMFQVMFTNVVEVSTILPSYFSTYGRAEPRGPGHIPTSFLAGRPALEYFELLNEDPARIETFMRAMSITHRNVPTTGMYDMGWVLRKAAEEPDRVVWVDVGGGDGHTLRLFCRRYPGLKGQQCVVQDLPEVVEAAGRKALGEDELEGVRWVPMNFHNEVPIKGALIYYLRHILRDYPDRTAMRILTNMASAISPGSDSRILIAEQLMETPPSSYSAFKDYSMLAIGGKERSLKQFTEIAAAAGLAVSGVFRDNGTAHAVVELKLKD
ncbi:O-methyltransferase-domain-containing protein [Lasiosphaeria hispida]|uniref:O-methyltransferase-domain-containing protein n=1 Tax=Lasiosphaeria hispida TaxID=260671 RepID=A0AAJ0MEA2_9PEZI|nr:O-methyltransferase-domain-containing protein [Lasiosphaeria hispida]